MAGELKVVVVDDDQWKRESMASCLDATDTVDVVADVDQDTAAGWRSKDWEGVNAVLVDILDDGAPGEIGTDLYSGITVLEHVARLPIRSIAVTPTCAHPVVQLRLLQAHPDYVYHRYQVATLELLSQALVDPARTHRPPELDAGEIKRLGAAKLLANDAVRSYVASPLHGKLTARAGLKELNKDGVSRRQVDRFKDVIVGHGYRFGDSLSPTQRKGKVYLSPRWPTVRDLVLTLLGRKDAALTEYDRPWWEHSL